MDRSLDLLQQDHWRVMDQSQAGIHVNALQSFGMDDTLCTSVGSAISPPTARAWVHQNTIVLGIQDTRLPFLKEGLSYLKDSGYHCIVRNSGGLAVVLDEGILNLSLILPESDKRIDINSGYDTMWDLIKVMFSDFDKQIEAREIVGSYCPGSYDLSIEGKKFAGISQRRIRNGVAVQIYLSVNGSGSKRAEVIKEFYSRALQNEETKFQYPSINPSVMASLSELFQTPLTVQDVMYRFLFALKEKANKISASQLSEEEWPLFESYYTRVVERNNKVLGEYNDI